MLISVSLSLSRFSTSSTRLGRNSCLSQVMSGYVRVGGFDFILTLYIVKFVQSMVACTEEQRDEVSTETVERKRSFYGSREYNVCVEIVAL